MKNNFWYVALLWLGIMTSFVAIYKSIQITSTSMSLDEQTYYVDQPSLSVRTDNLPSSSSSVAAIETAKAIPENLSISNTTRTKKTINSETTSTPALRTRRKEVEQRIHIENDTSAFFNLLSVPYYVYEELSWIDGTFNGQKISTFVKDGFKNNIKHTNDYHFAAASFRHPLRTLNASEAKLFVVPILMNIYDMKSYHYRNRKKTKKKNKRNSDSTQSNNDNDNNMNLCARGYCNKELLGYTTKVLQKSIWFQKYPHLHIVTTSHYAFDKEWWSHASKPTSLRHALYDMNAITYENRISNNGTSRYHFPSYLVGNPCPMAATTTSTETEMSPTTTKHRRTNDDNDKKTDTKLHDVAMIAKLNTDFEPNQPYFQDRRNICHWLSHEIQQHESNIGNDQGKKEEFNNDNNNVGNATNSNNDRSHRRMITVSICGTGKQCPALSNAKLGIHSRGDTFGSQRLMDTILSGTVPIFTRKEQYLVQPSWIDWNQLSYFIDLETCTNSNCFLKQLSSILNNDYDGDNLPPASSLSLQQYKKQRTGPNWTYDEKLSAIQRHRPLFDWTTLYPFDTYMYMLQAKLYPETILYTTSSMAETTNTSTTMASPSRLSPLKRIPDDYPFTALILPDRS